MQVGYMKGKSILDQQQMKNSNTADHRALHPIRNGSEPEKDPDQK